MAIHFKKSEIEEIILDKIRFNPYSNEFVLSSTDFPEFERKFKFSFEKNKQFSNLSDSNFKIFLFNKSEFAGNDIIKVCDNKTNAEENNGRLGFLIPIQSLITSEHDYGQNEHFTPYAYHAIRKLLIADDSIPYKKLELPTFDNINLESLYGENTHVSAPVRNGTTFRHETVPLQYSGFR